MSVVRPAPPEDGWTGRLGTLPKHTNLISTWPLILRLIRKLLHLTSKLACSYESSNDPSFSELSHVSITFKKCPGRMSWASFPDSILAFFQCSEVIFLCALGHLA